MNSLWETTSGSVIGRYHHLAKINNQDAKAVYFDDDLLIGVISDGCGDRIMSPYSEVGARQAVTITIEAIRAEIATEKAKTWFGTSFIRRQSFWYRVEKRILRRIRILVLASGADFKTTVLSNYQFTLVGAVVTANVAVFFCYGDGVIVVNGKLISITSGSENEPAYICYHLLESSLVRIDPSRLEFQLVSTIDSRKLQSFLIGSDGVNDLVAAQNMKIPGQSEQVGSIDNFWRNDQYFENEFALGRMLAKLNREVVRPNWENREIVRESGLLPDDTTVIVGRRRKENK